MIIKYKPTIITELLPGHIFVFGSNLAGRHGAGAALTALQKFGAIYGRGVGIQGYSYGIPTKDEHIVTLPLKRIGIYICEFLDFAREHPMFTFELTAIGCGLAGYKPREIAPLFKGYPDNVKIPKEFKKYLQ